MLFSQLSILNFNDCIFYQNPVIKIQFECKLNVKMNTDFWNFLCKVIYLRGSLTTCQLCKTLCKLCKDNAVSRPKTRFEHMFCKVINFTTNFLTKIAENFIGKIMNIQAYIQSHFSVKKTAFTFPSSTSPLLFLQDFRAVPCAQGSRFHGGTSPRRAYP